MEEWKSYTVGDIYNVQNGYAFRSGDFYEEGTTSSYEVLKIGHIEIGGGLRQNPKRNYVDRIPKYSKWVLKKGDIVMGMTDMKSNIQILGVPAMVDISDHYALNQRVGRLSIKDPNNFDNDFFYFQMRSDSFLEELRKKANSGVQVNLTTDAIRTTHLYAPSYKTQCKIGRLLRCLEDKIALNNRINHNLEAQAQALYKSWFVDFEPFKDGEFVVSELGIIPKGWHIGTIYDICEIYYGAPFNSSLFNSERKGLPLIRIRDLAKQEGGVYTQEMHPKGQLTKKGDILVGMDGEFSIYIWGGNPSWINQRISRFTPLDGVSHFFLTETLRPQLKAVESSEVATTVIHIGKNDYDKFCTLIPPREVLDSFYHLTEPLYFQLVENLTEIQQLSESRDVLLPRLMSGQITC